MARVKIHDGDAKTAAPDAPDLPKDHFEIAAGGMTIRSRETLRVREEMQLSEHLGTDTRMNPVWVLWATVACCVTHIDGEPVRMPTSKLQIEALVDRIGDDAMRALLVRYRQNSEAREARVVAAAKN